MANQNPITFPYSTHEVRVVMIDDSPWFVAADVCKVLAHTNPTVALSRLDDDETQVIDFATLNISEGRENQALSKFEPQSINIINESGLYSLILTSRKPEAKKFKKWVTNEVLPTIRKTGKYEMPKPQDRAEECITRTQLDQIATLVHEIMTCCHYGDSATHATYAGIREQYGIENIHKLPSIHFEKVYGTLHVLREKAFEYLKLRTAIDKQFIKDVLRYHQLQMQCQAELFLPK